MTLHKYLGAVGLALGLFVASSCGDDTSAEPLSLGSFISDDATFEFVSAPNSERPDAPCVGVNAVLPDQTTNVMACPAQATEVDSYAATVRIAEEDFVVGFGLCDDESIVLDQATRTLVTDRIDGRRFFLLQLQVAPSSGAVVIPVLAESGASREILTTTEESDSVGESSSCPAR